MATYTTAQAELDAHLAVDAGGRCLTCRGLEPCDGRVRAHAMFAMLGQLPRRRPGVLGAFHTHRLKLY